jgi:hypothetical protein
LRNLRNPWVLAGAGALVVVVLVVTAILVIRPDSYTVRFKADGVAPVTVTAPGEAGRPKLSALAAPPPESVPAGVRLLSRPVRIKAKKFRGDATIRMRYDPAALPAGAVSTEDVDLFVFATDLGMWVPVGATVGTDSATVATNHFSDWAVGVTDPRALSDQQALERRLNKGVTGYVGRLLAGEQDTLSCDPNRLLLPAEVKSAIAQGVKLCEEILEDGTYRMQWVNTTGLPIVVDLPEGFTEEDTDYHTDVLLQGFLDGRNHPRGAIIANGGSLAVRFADGAVPRRDTFFGGDVDWALYLILTARLILNAALSIEETDNPKVRDAIDRAATSANVINCAVDVMQKLRDSDLGSAILKGIGNCLEETVTALVSAVVAALGLKDTLKQAIKGFFKRRVNPILAVKDLLELARNEVAGLTALSFKAMGGFDTSVLFHPTRVMSHPETVQLALTQADLEPHPWERCAQLTELQFLPAGMTDYRGCVQSVALDLDGNGRPDRLLLWRPRLPDVTELLDPRRMGAVAYLDDGTFHLLERPVSGWGGDFANPNAFDFTSAVHLGEDSRAQAVVLANIGSSLNHHIVLAVGADRRLRPVEIEGNIADLSVGAAASYGGAYGCVVSNGKPLLVLKGFTADVSVENAPTEWGRTYYRFDGHTLTRVGEDSGSAATLGQTPSAGSDCTTADPAKRGPEVGAVPR